MVDLCPGPDERIGTGDMQIGLRNAHAQQYRTRLVIWSDDAEKNCAKIKGRKVVRKQ
jgi:hypothetical protein